MVQGGELGTGRKGLHLNLVSLYLGGVKGMQWLPQFVQHIIGDIHHIVDGGEAYGQEPVLEPERGFLDNQVADRQAAVTGGQAAVLYDDIYFQGTVVNGKIAGGGGDKLLLYLFLFQAGLEVPGHAKMAHGIGTVGGQANFKDLIALHLEYLGTWGAGLQPLI